LDGSGAVDVLKVFSHDTVEAEASRGLWSSPMKIGATIAATIP
jgi:hypothetical protein